MSTDSPSEQSDQTHQHVSEAEIEAAMGVNSVPDEVRLHSSDPDETEQVMDSTGQLRGPADRG